MISVIAAAGAAVSVGAGASSINDDSPATPYVYAPPSSFDVFITWFMIGFLIVVPLTIMIAAFWLSRKK